MPICNITDRLLIFTLIHLSFQGTYMNSKLFILFLVTIIPTYSIAKETLEFSCTTRNHGKITIHSTPHQEYYIYRFYKNGKLQLKIKQDKKTIYQQTMEQNPIHTIEANTMTFVNGKYLYTISNVFTFKTFKKKKWIYHNRWNYSRRSRN